MRPFELDLVGLGLQLREAREALRLTLADVGKRAGVAPSHLWNIENGKKEASIERCMLIAGSLGLPLSRLIARNLKVDRTYFLPLIKHDMKEIGVGKELPGLVSDYCAGCCVVLAHALLSEQGAIDSRSFEYPSQRVADAFDIVFQRIRTGAGDKERATWLASLRTAPFRLVYSFGLVLPRLAAELRTPWIPSPRRPTPIASHDLLAGYNPERLGAALREAAASTSEELLALMTRAVSKRKK